jgi:hypothetical protein
MTEPNWEDLLSSQAGQWWNNVQTNLGNFGAGVGQYFNGLDLSKLNDPKSSVGYMPIGDAGLSGPTLGANYNQIRQNTAAAQPKGKAIVDNGAGGGSTAPQADSYMNLLKSLLEQANGGPSYGAALQSIRNERKGVNTRYKQNQGDIKSMFGNLTTMRRNDIPGVSQLAQTGREQSAAQTSGYAQQMINAENQRLAAANEARQALGLGDIAAAAAGGDVATESSNAQVANMGALSQIGRTASEINQNITEQAINDEIERYSTEQNQSLAELDRSRTSALADISSREQQVLMQQAQAQAAAQQASTQLQLQIAGLIGEYETGKLEAGTPKDALGKFLYENGAQADPALGENAAYVGSSFQNWLLSESPVNPATNKPYTPQEIPSVIAKFDPEIGARIRKDPRLNNLVTALYLSASGK